MYIHLEGTLSSAFEFELAKKNNIELSQDDPAFKSPESLLERYSRFTSLDDFLHYYFIGMSVLRTSEDFEELAMAYFKHAAADEFSMLKCSSTRKRTRNVVLNMRL